MINISDKDVRKELVSRYLDAGTTPDEERVLVDHYLNNDNVDSDELPFARLIRMEHADNLLLSAKGAEEYDRMTGNAGPRTTRPSSRRWSSCIGGIAAGMALLLVLNFPRHESDITDLTQSLQQLIELNTDGDATVTATPIGESVWVEVEYADGNKKTYIMNRDKAMDTVSFMAIN